MSYEVLAPYYDELMKEVPYEEWIRIFQELMQDKGVSSVLDVGAGTGKITIPLLQKGYDVSAVDLSDEMLAVLHEKLEESSLTAPLFCQDMASLDLQKEFDCIISFCDSINYLSSLDEVLQTFKCFYEHIKPGGYLLFDSHSIYKMKYIYPEVSFGFAGNDVSYIWNVFEGEIPNSVFHELTFFVQSENGLYERFDEDQVQLAFSKEEYENALVEAGFTNITTFTDFQIGNWADEGERMFFVCEKPKK